MICKMESTLEGWCLFHVGVNFIQPHRCHFSVIVSTNYRMGASVIWDSFSKLYHFSTSMSSEPNKNEIDKIHIVWVFRTLTSSLHGDTTPFPHKQAFKLFTIGFLILIRTAFYLNIISGNFCEMSLSNIYKPVAKGGMVGQCLSPHFFKTLFVCPPKNVWHLILSS